MTDTPVIMRVIVYTIVAHMMCNVAHLSPVDPSVSSPLCRHEWCQCGHDSVQCLCDNYDTTSANDDTTWLVIGNGTTSLSNDVRRLSIKNCSRVRIQKDQSAISLHTLEIDTVKSVELSEDALSSCHELNNVRLFNIADLNIEPHAVPLNHTEKSSLKLHKVNTKQLSHSVFGHRPKISHLAIGNCSIKNAELSFREVQLGSIVNNDIGVLQLTTDKSQQVMFHHNRVTLVKKLHINTEANYHDTTSILILDYNLISQMTDTESSVMARVGQFSMMHNQLDRLTAVMNVSFVSAVIAYNTVEVMGERVMSHFAQIPNIEPRIKDHQLPPAGVTLIANKLKRPSTSYTFSRIFTPASDVTLDRVSEYRVADNEIGCSCHSTKELAKLASQQLSAMNDSDVDSIKQYAVQNHSAEIPPVAEHHVYGAFYLTTKCYSRMTTLSEFTTSSFTDDWQCKLASDYSTAGTSVLMFHNSENLMTMLILTGVFNYVCRY